MKRMIVLGAGGQDGRILYDRLRDDGHTVLGIARGSVRCTEPCALGRIDFADRQQVRALIGDATKLRTATGWKPSVAFAEMIARLLGLR